MSILQRVSYNPLVIRSARALGLRRALRRAYYLWARPRTGVMRIKLGEFEVSFYVRTPEQLRIVGKAGAGEWRLEVVRFLDDKLRPGDVVFDVGSNIGICTVFAARKVGATGQVVAFEPAPETYAALMENVRLNGLGNVRAFRAALADYEGDGGLFTGEDLLFSSLVVSRSGAPQRQPVRVLRGDRWRENERLPAPGIVMIDVEGFELGVLKGLEHTLSEVTCRAVIAEVHPTLLPPGVQSEDVLRFLASCGFTRCDTFRWARHPGVLRHSGTRLRFRTAARKQDTSG